MGGGEGRGEEKEGEKGKSLPGGVELDDDVTGIAALVDV